MGRLTKTLEQVRPAEDPPTPRTKEQRRVDKDLDMLLKRKTVMRQVGQDTSAIDEVIGDLERRSIELLRSRHSST